MTLEEGNKRTIGGSSGFYRIRRRVYGGLLIFLIATGVSMTAVPALRSRLIARIQELTSAVSGETKPAMVQAGEIQDPFPEEFERPSYPSVTQVLNIPTAPFVYDGPIRRESQPRSTPRRTLKIPSVGEALPLSGEGEEQGEPSEPDVSVDDENRPDYKQGTIEQEAYTLLKSNPAIEALVQGSDPSLKFVTWDAANRGEDIYWVRLKFQQDDIPEVEYIWQVRIQAKTVTPLNFNARALQQTY